MQFNSPVTVSTSALLNSFNTRKMVVDFQRGLVSCEEWSLLLFEPSWTVSSYSLTGFKEKDVESLAVEQVVQDETGFLLLHVACWLN